MSDLSPALFALQGERADERVRKRPALGPSLEHLLALPTPAIAVADLPAFNMIIFR
jgi:hypothetical protein